MSQTKAKGMEKVFAGFSTTELIDLHKQLEKRSSPLVIVCPYCHENTEEGKTFCCDQLRGALNLIFSRSA